MNRRVAFRESRPEFHDPSYALVAPDVWEFDFRDRFSIDPCSGAVLRVQVALAYACIEDFGEDLVLAWLGYGPVVHEIEGSAEVADEGDGLLGGDWEGGHWGCGISGCL